jgi:hypothetical protein
MKMNQRWLFHSAAAEQTKKPQIFTKKAYFAQRNLFSRTSKSHLLNFFYWAAAQTCLTFCLDTKSKQKNQGSILSFPPDVGIIFACKIATFRVIFEQRLSASRKVPAFCFIKISR